MITFSHALGKSVNVIKAFLDQVKEFEFEGKWLYVLFQGKNETVLNIQKVFCHYSYARVVFDK